jgi:glutaredoxin
VPDRNTLPAADVVLVYGADWCGDCHRSRRYLESTGTPYRWIDLGSDPAAQRLVDDAGYRAIPVIVTPAGDVLVEPSDAELARALAGAA